MFRRSEFCHFFSTAALSAFVVRAAMFMSALHFGGGPTDVVLADEVLTQHGDTNESEEQRRAQVAYERFLQVLQRQPKPGTALDRVYGFHVERGTLAAFISSLQRKATSNESSDDIGAAWMLLGLVELQRGKDSEAAVAFREAEAIRTNDALASWLLGSSLHRLGQLTSATAAYERAIVRGPEKNDLLQIFQELGRAYRRSQQPHKADEVWQRMELQFPDDVRVKEQIATVLDEEGDHEAALIRFSELATLHRDPYRATQCAMTAAELKVKLGRKSEALKDFESQLAKLDPESWLYREARRKIEDVFLRTDDQAGLIRYYESWLSSHPKDLEAMSRIGRALAVQGLLKESRAWYEKAVQSAPSNVGLRKSLIEQLLREELYADAILQYEQLHRYDNGNADHIEEWGLLYLRRDDLSKEARRAKAAEVWNLLLSDRDDDPSVVIRVAELLRRADLADDALSLYQKAVSLAPREPQYREYLGEFLHSLNRTQEAVSIWKSIAEGDQRSTQNLIRVADILQSFSHKELALAAIAAACELDPGLHDRIRYADMLSNVENDDQHNTQEALRQLTLAEESAESDADRATILNQRIRTLMAGRLLEPFTRALAEDLGKGNVVTAERWRTLANYYYASEQFTSALESLENALRLEPESIANWKLAGQLFEAVGRNADAADANRQLAKLDQRFSTDYLRKIATLEQKMGRLRQAQQAGEELVAVAPGNPEHLHFYAELCFQLGQNEVGLNALRRAVRANPSDENAMLTLANALTNRNELVEAIELYWKAFEISSTLDAQTEIAASLAELYLRTNQFDRLVQKLELRSKELAKRRECVMCLAAAFRVAGDHRSARQRLEELLTPESRDVNILTELCRIAEVESDLDAAAGFQRRINAVSASVEGKVRLADLLLRLGEISEAEALWIQVGEINAPPHEVVRMIDKLLSLDNIDSAKHLCAKVLQRQPENWEALLRLGLIELAYGKNDSALAVFDQILALKTDPKALAAEGILKFSKSSVVTSESATAMPREMERLEYAMKAARTVENSQRDTNSSSRLNRLSTLYRYLPMPADFGEARCLCLLAKWKAAESNERMQTFLSELEAKNSELKTLSSFWDLNTTYWLMFELNGEPGVSEKWLRSVETAAKTESLAVMCFCIHLVAKHHENQQKQASGPGLAVDSNWISVDQALLAIAAFETVLQSNPEWLWDIDPMTILDVCMATGKAGEIDALAERWMAKAAFREQRLAALDISLAQRKLTAEESLRLLEAALKLPRHSKGVFRDQEELNRRLEAIVEAANEEQRVDVGYKILIFWLKSKTLSTQPLTTTGYEALPVSAADWLPLPPWLDEADASLLDLIAGTTAEHRSEFLRWCKEYRMKSSPTEAFYLDLVQASLSWTELGPSETIVHLIHAAEFVPDDARLRMMIIELCQKLGQSDDALALLEKIPDIDPSLLRVREFKSLSLALKVGNMERAKSAAERLYGLQLNPDERTLLIPQLRRLGLKDMADHVESRKTNEISSDLASSPLTLLDMYEKQGNQVAAVQVAQQLIRRATGGGTPWRGNLRTTSEEIRQRAFDVLIRAGELDRMIERQKKQLEKSPHSGRIRQTLVDYLTAAGRHEETASIQQEMTAEQSAESNEALLNSAQVFLQSNRNDQACEVLLKLISRAPKFFWQKAGKFDFWLESKYQLQLVDAILISEQGRSESYAPTLDLEQLLKALLSDEREHSKAAELLGHMLRMYPTYTMSFLDVVDTVGGWQSPELFAVLQNLYVPNNVEDSLKPQLAWPEQYEFMVSRFGYLEKYSLRGGNLAPLCSALSTNTQRRIEFEQSVLVAQTQFPEWQGGNVLLVVSALQGQSHEDRTETLCRKLMDSSQHTLPPAVAHNLAALLENRGRRMQLLAVKLLQQSVNTQSGVKLELDSPAASRLLAMYVATEEFDRGIELIEQQIGAAEQFPRELSKRDRRETGNRIVASRFLPELGRPLDALRLLNVISELECDWYVDQVSTRGWQFPYLPMSKDPNVRKQLLGFATGAITPGLIAGELRGRTSATPHESVAPDLRLEARKTENGPFPVLESDTLNLLQRKWSRDADSLELLNKALQASLRSNSADTSLMMMGLTLISKSGSSELRTQIAPAIDEYLSTPLHASIVDRNPELARTKYLQAQLCFSCIAEAWNTDEGQIKVGRKMHERAVSAARQLASEQFLMAALSAQGEFLMAHGDSAAAEAAWNEVLSLLVAEPEPDLNRRSALPTTEGLDGSGIDIGAELRRSLLKHLAP